MFSGRASFSACQTRLGLRSKTRAQTAIFEAKIESLPPMKTLNIAISEKQFVKYGFPKEQLTFDEFVKLLKKDLAQEALRKCREIARKSGLSRITMEEIDAEIAAVRQARKMRRYAQTGA